jgi:hypothetical protein
VKIVKIFVAHATKKIPKYLEKKRRKEETFYYLIQWRCEKCEGKLAQQFDKESIDCFLVVSDWKKDDYLSQCCRRC